MIVAFCLDTLSASPTTTFTNIMRQTKKPLYSLVNIQHIGIVHDTQTPFQVRREYRGYIPSINAELATVLPHGHTHGHLQ